MILFVEMQCHLERAITLNDNCVLNIFDLERRSITESTSLSRALKVNNDTLLYLARRYKTQKEIDYFTNMYLAYKKTNIKAN